MKQRRLSIELVGPGFVAKHHLEAVRRLGGGWRLSASPARAPLRPNARRKNQKLDKRFPVIRSL